METEGRGTDDVLIVYPQDRFYRQAAESFRTKGLPFETIVPPAAWNDVALGP